MSQIITLKQSYIEISCGVITAETITGKRGVRKLDARIGQHLFFVEVVKADGSRTCTWEASTREEAMREAEQWRNSGWGPVVDRVQA